MNRSHFSFLSVVFASIIFCLPMAHSAAQEIGLVTADAKEVAKGYRADALRLKPVVNEKGERIGRIDDFIFGKDESIFVPALLLQIGNKMGKR